jgi:hypothetical protein
MEVENRTELMEEFVLHVARTYFPMLTSESFPLVFKFILSQVVSHLEHKGKLDDRLLVRNFLLFVYWVRHYPPLKTLGAYFGLKKTQACDIVHAQLRHYGSLFEKHVNVSSADTMDGYFLPWVIGIVDCTEILIESWIPVCELSKRCF